MLGTCHKETDATRKTRKTNNMLVKHLMKVPRRKAKKAASFNSVLYPSFCLLQHSALNKWNSK
jgi:hypothetical protein